MRQTTYPLLIVVMLTLVIEGCASAKPVPDWQSQGRERIHDPLTHAVID